MEGEVAEVGGDGVVGGGGEESVTEKTKGVFGSFMMELVFGVIVMRVMVEGGEKS